MKTIRTYFNRIKRAVPMTAIALLLMANFSCERRDLWVYQDNFENIELNIDWRNYNRDKQLYPHTPDPDGMTVWFFPKDGRKSYHYTTAEVRKFRTYLSEGDYEALVIDYSPSEYGNQEFIGMDYAESAEVRSLPAAYQFEEYPELFGTESYSKTLPKQPDAGIYTISCQPEVMASDTADIHSKTGKYANYIPYEERDTYQSTLTTSVYNMEPLVIPWKMRVRIYIKGIYYLYGVKASIAGLADGFYLAKNQTSDDPCLMSIDDWELHLEKDSDSVEGGIGYIAKTFYTWGLRDNMWSIHNYDPKNPRPPFYVDAASNEIRLNFRFLLRDRKTVCTYHFDMGDRVRVFQNEYALRIDLEEDDENVPVLPYVEGYNGLGFDGLVVPWEEGENAEITF